MKISVLGTGMVGHAIATRLCGLGHAVMMGARTDDNPKAHDWAAANSGRSGSFKTAAQFGDIIFNCTNGANTLGALDMAGADAIGGKILADVSNPLDLSHGMPPTLLMCNTDSLGEQIQRAFPKARVVKTLCTVNADIMVDPRQLPGNHHVFVSGEDKAAKAEVSALLASFGWNEIIDLGGIATARGQEMAMPLWLALWGTLGTPRFNFALVRADPAKS